VCDSILNEGDTVLDVGANIGQSCLPFSRSIGPSGRCYAFECNPISYNELTKAIAANPIANIFPKFYAMSDVIGYTKLYFGDASHSAEAATIIEKNATADRLGNVSHCLVETMTIDQFCEQFRIEPQLIKIDVEGSEAIVLKGAARTIARIKGLAPALVEIG
jgi:FkbM family methyltransferase